MIADFGRALLRLCAGLLLLLLALWLAFPIWIPPLTAALLAEADSELLTLETARPTPSGIEVDRLALVREETRLELEDARLTWRPHGQLERLRIGRVTVRIETADVGEEEATEDAVGSVAASAAASAAALPDPSELLRRLPVDHIDVEVLEVEVPPRVRFSGCIDADRTRAEVEGTLTGQALSEALAVSGSFQAGGSLALRVEDAAGSTALDAALKLSTRSGALAIAGQLAPGATLLPALVADAPTVSGTLSIALQLAAADARLRLRPGTQLRVSALAPTFAASLAPAVPWTLRLRDGRIESEGALEARFDAGLPPGAAEASAGLTGRLRLTRLEGTAQALDFESDGDVELNAAELTAEADVTLRGRLSSRTALTLAAGSGVQKARIAHAASALRVEDIDLLLASPTTLDLATPDTLEAAMDGRAKTLQTGAQTIDLSALRTRAALSGSTDDPQLELTVDGGGVDLHLLAAIAGGAPRVELRNARADGLPGDLLPAVVLAFAPDVELQTGTLQLDALRWPPTPTTAATLHVAGVSIATPQARLEGLDARLALRFGEDVPALALESGQLRTLESDQLSGEDLSFSARARLPGWGLAEAGAGALPETLQLDALELLAGRVAVGTQEIDALALSGTARVTTGATTAALEVSAPSLRTTVPASDLRCGIELEGDRLVLRDCGLDLLGGRVEIPAGSIELATLDGYFPVAVQGLDLGAVLILMQDEALAGVGTLDGALPVRVAEGLPTIDEGYVGARAPGGLLRYAAAPALRARLNQPGISLALAALDDFRYRELGASVDYAADGTLDLRVRLAGANPSVEQGRAIEFNLDVTQNLPLLLQSLRLSQTIDEAIERRLQERGLPR